MGIDIKILKKMYLVFVNLIFVKILLDTVNAGLICSLLFIDVGLYTLNTNNS